MTIKIKKKTRGVVVRLLERKRREEWRALHSDIFSPNLCLLRVYRPQNNPGSPPNSVGGVGRGCQQFSWRLPGQGSMPGPRE